MRGFVIGSVVLIGLYVLGTDNASTFAGLGLSTVASWVRRAADPSVAAIPQTGFRLITPHAGGGGGSPKVTTAPPASNPGIWT